MVRRSPILTAVLLVAALFSSGCLFRSHKVPVRTVATAARSATMQELLTYINQQAAAIKTLNATVDIDTTVGGAKKGKVTEFQQIRGYILVSKPAKLRMIGLFPVVRNRAFDMVSDTDGFKLYIPAQNKFIVGPPDVTKPSTNTLENLRPSVIYDALLLHPVDPNNEIAVLENGEEAVVTDVKSKKQISYPTYIVDVIQRGPQGWFLQRKVVFSRTDLLPHRQLIYDKQGNLATEAIYENYQNYNGVQFPTSITITRPQEEYTIGLSVLKLIVNEPMKDEQFALNQPPGSNLVRLDANGNSNTEKPAPGGGTEKQ
jgi:outer membrane lipoprotein-sorting protein